MRIDRIAIATALALALGTAYAQIHSGASAGIAPPAPPAGTTDTVVVPAITPATPGVMPLEVGSSPADRTLRDSVAAALTSDPELQGARINVTVSNGVVTLSGSARDLAQANRARAAAERVAGSARVDASISTGG